MNKSFFYTIDKSVVPEYTKILNLMKVPYLVEEPVVLLREGSSACRIVFPNMPASLYGMVRKLFGRDGEPYPL
ncbi:hypothetical protein [Brevibacillus fulvus]|uniref:Uncharacterized protein n=1 Tax=Brevibacillus fulvus TaxID=1125967 RepID=A0A939BR47_9BACL|nr:hypothetical protein [Brevibacillus fulvus]MBM7589083.1 hypothetical protein [Brevibacillus fulvus]